YSELAFDGVPPPTLDAMRDPSGSAVHPAGTAIELSGAASTSPLFAPRTQSIAGLSVGLCSTNLPCTASCSTNCRNFTTASGASAKRSNLSKNVANLIQPYQLSRRAHGKVPASASHGFQ